MHLRNALNWKSFVVGLATAAMTFAFVGCDVDVEDSGELPNVEVEPGEMPDVDVEGPDVDVDTEERDVTVPDVDVEMEEETVTVPDVDVDLPDDDDQ